MHSLIVIAHPEPGSLTHAIAHRIGDAISGADSRNTVAYADLIAEGFDPRFNRHDQALFRGTGAVPADVAAEHARLDASDALVLVYPLYWWSLPAVLKGWIDRVFTRAGPTRMAPTAKCRRSCSGCACTWWPSAAPARRWSNAVATLRR